MSIQDESSYEDISNEDIKYLVFRTEPEEIKYPMYISKFRDKVRQEMKKNRDCHRTMGYAHGFRTCPPDNYLKKKSRKVFVAQVDKPEKISGPNNAPLPKKEDWNQLAPRAEQNHIVNNIRTVVKMKPPTGPSRVFDPAVGKRVHNCNLRMPAFTLSEDVGKIPSYLEKIKRKIKEDGNTSSKSLTSRQSPTKREIEQPPRASIDRRVRVLSEQERDALLQNLKAVWAEMQREFQLLPVMNVPTTRIVGKNQKDIIESRTLPVINEAPSKMKRREWLMAKLIVIEKDIRMIEENARIYIIEDPKDPRCGKPVTPDACYQNLNYIRKNTVL